MIYAKERIRGEVMSQYINGDRIIYIAPNPTPPLPEENVKAIRVGSGTSHRKFTASDVTHMDIVPVM